MKNTTLILLSVGLNFCSFLLRAKSMGNAAARIRAQVSESFDELLPHGKQYLTLDQLLAFPRPSDEFHVDLAHLGTLFVLNSPELDGRFRLEHLVRFIDICVVYEALPRKYDLATHIHGSATRDMYRQLTDDPEVFVEWLTKVLAENDPILTFPAYPRLTFVSRESVSAVHRLLRIGPMYGLDSQEFLDLLQRVGEERGMMNIEDESLDDVVPLEVIEIFARGFVDGFLSLMRDIGVYM